MTSRSPCISLRKRVSGVGLYHIRGIEETQHLT